MWVSEWVCAWVSQWVSEWMNKDNDKDASVKEWKRMCKWVNEWVKRKFILSRGAISAHIPARNTRHNIPSFLELYPVSSKPLPQIVPRRTDSTKSIIPTDLIIWVIPCSVLIPSPMKLQSYLFPRVLFKEIWSLPYKTLCMLHEVFLDLYHRKHTIRMCSGITRGRVLNGELYAQILQKLIYLNLFTGCFMKTKFVLTSGEKSSWNSLQTNSG